MKAKFTTEMAIKVAQMYIMESGIMDDDQKQNVYLHALEYRDKKNNKYPYSFKYYMENDIKKKDEKESIEDLMGNVFKQCERDFVYVPEYDNAVISEDLLYNINKLPEIYQKALYQRFICDLSFTKIGQELDISTERARQIVNQAIKVLRSKSGIKVLKGESIENCIDDRFTVKFKDLLNNQYNPIKISTLQNVVTASDQSYAWQRNTEINMPDKAIGVKLIDTYDNCESFSIFYENNWFIINTFIDTDTGKLAIVADEEIYDTIPEDKLHIVCDYIAKHFWGVDC